MRNVTAAPLVGGLRAVRLREPLVVDEEHQHQRDEVERRGHEERAPQPDDRREHAADHRPERRPEPLRRLHRADRLRHASRGADSAAIASDSAP